MQGGGLEGAATARATMRARSPFLPCLAMEAGEEGWKEVIASQVCPTMVRNRRGRARLLVAYQCLQPECGRHPTSERRGGRAGRMRGGLPMWRC